MTVHKIPSRFMKFVLHAAQNTENSSGFYGVHSYKGIYWSSSSDERCALVVTNPEYQGVFGRSVNILDKLKEEGVKLSSEDLFVFNQIIEGGPLHSINLLTNELKRDIVGIAKPEMYPFIQFETLDDKPHAILLDAYKNQHYKIQLDCSVFTWMAQTSLKYFSQAIRNWPQEPEVKLGLLPSGKLILYNEGNNIMVILCDTSKLEEVEEDDIPMD